jgi:hypothetical protein
MVGRGLGDDILGDATWWCGVCSFDLDEKKPARRFPFD